MEKLSDHRFEKRLKKVAKIINSDRFYFYYEGDSLSFYDEYIKIIKIITNKRAINEDRDWANDRLIILDHLIIINFPDCQKFDRFLWVVKNETLLTLKTVFFLNSQTTGFTGGHSLLQI